MIRRNVSAAVDEQEALDLAVEEALEAGMTHGEPCFRCAAVEHAHCRIVGCGCVYCRTHPSKWIA